jgi:hypothetical protein
MALKRKGEGKKKSKPFFCPAAGKKTAKVKAFSPFSLALGERRGPGG